jgi:hypothetical protein
MAMRLSGLRTGRDLLPSSIIFLLVVLISEPRGLVQPEAVSQHGNMASLNVDSLYSSSVPRFLYFGTSCS